MHILVIGASSGIGLHTVKRALEAGHSVRAFSRHASAMDIDHPALEKIDGDATVPADVEPALAGIDAVVMALGVPHDASILWKPVTLFSEATEAVLRAMDSHGVRRLIVVTGFGAGDSKAKLSTLERLPFWVVLSQPYKDKDRQEVLIKESDTDWTIVRPTILTNGPMQRGYKVLTRPESWRNGLISRASVADFLVTEAETGAHPRGEVVLAR